MQRQTQKQLLLDMDGTLLDLKFDTYFWDKYLVQRYAEQVDISREESQDLLKAIHRQSQYQLKWYCVDFWSEKLQCDVLEIMREIAKKITAFPQSESFLQSMQQRTDIKLFLVTDAHPQVLALKLQHTGLAKYFDTIVSSHTFGYSKSQQQFWQSFSEEYNIHKKSAVFVDDNPNVLQSALKFGIENVVVIARNDSSKPKKETLNFNAIDNIAQLEI